MVRVCSHCREPFTSRDLARSVSRDLEHERKAQGVRGVHFVYYACPHCGYADIFVDLLPLQGETPEQYRQRREEMEATARQLQGEQVEVVVNERTGSLR